MKATEGQKTMSLKTRIITQSFKPRRFAYMLSMPVLFLTACQTSGPNGAAKTQAQPSQNSAQVVRVDSLAPRDLSPGECGLFVWAGEARRFLLFTQNGTRAVLAKDGAEITLTPQPANISGDLYGQIPVQNFTDANGTDYALALTGEDAIEGGLRYRSGTWRYKDAAGWDVLTPVYGLSSCQARN